MTKNEKAVAQLESCGITSKIVKSQWRWIGCTVK
jgi:hypothetical protein